MTCFDRWVTGDHGPSLSQAETMFYHGSLARTHRIYNVVFATLLAKRPHNERTTKELTSYKSRGGVLTEHAHVPNKV